MKLEKVMKEYKDIILGVINVLEKEDYDNIEGFIDEREKILQVIGISDFSKMHIKKLFQEYKIKELEDGMFNMIESKKEEIKSEIQRNQVNKRANKIYNKNTTKSVFLSREI